MRRGKDAGVLAPALRALFSQEGTEQREEHRENVAICKPGRVPLESSLQPLDRTSSIRTVKRNAAVQSSQPCGILLRCGIVRH